MTALFRPALTLAFLGMLLATSTGLAQKKKPKSTTTVTVSDPIFHYNKLKTIKLLHGADLNNCTPGDLVQKYAIKYTKGSKSTVTASGSVTVSSKVAAKVNSGFAQAGVEHSVSGTLSAGAGQEYSTLTEESVSTTATVPECTQQTLKVTQPIWEFSFEVTVTTTKKTWTFVRKPHECPNSHIIHHCRYGHWVPEYSSSSETITVKGETHKFYKVDLKPGGECGNCEGNKQTSDFGPTTGGETKIGVTGQASRTLSQALSLGYDVHKDALSDSGLRASYLYHHPGFGQTAAFTVDVSGFSTPLSTVLVAITAQGELPRYEVVEVDMDGHFYSEIALVSDGAFAIELFSKDRISDLEVQ